MTDPRSMRLAALHVAHALAREHVREQGGNNRGPMVERIIRYAQGQVGEPWCVDFVIYCYGHVGSHAEQPGAPRAVSSMVIPGVHVTRDAGPGCPVRYTFDHTGLLLGWRQQHAGHWVPCHPADATHIETIEGNTTSTDSLESDSRDGGDGVYVKIRPLAVVEDFLHVDR